MTTEEKVLEILWDQGGEAPITTIASLAKISVDYARLICQNLVRHQYIKFDSGIAKLKGKGKLEAAKRKVDFPSKIVVKTPVSGRKKLVLNY